MNPKFQELLLKVAPMVGDDDNNTHLPSLHTPQQIEQFAQMLVSCCLNVINETGNDVENGNGMETFFKEHGNHPGPIAWLCADRIKERFGLN